MKIAKEFGRVAFILLLIFSAQNALAIDLGRADVKQFIDSMVSKHDYDKRALKQMLREAKSQDKILEAISKNVSLFFMASCTDSIMKRLHTS